MENYYKKYKLWTLYFGAFYSGKRYILPNYEINPLQFNRFFSPFYIDFINLPENGYISYINFLEPLHTKTNKSGADSIYFLPERIDTFEVDFVKLKNLYSENCDQQLTTAINYFGNNLIYNPNSGNFNENKWSNANELYNLIYNLSLSYTGNLTGVPFGARRLNIISPVQKRVFSGIGYNLNECYGCVDDISYFIISGDKEKEYYPNCDIPPKELKSAKFNIKYNTYNLFYNSTDSVQTLISLNSEKIDLKKIPFKNYIRPFASNQDLLNSFKTGYEIRDQNFTFLIKTTGETITGSSESLARTKNEIPLFFRTLNFNSPTLTPYFDDDKSNQKDILNASGGAIKSYKYLPNIKCGEKVYGSRLFNVPFFLSERDISPEDYTYEIYNSLFSGISAYEYDISEKNFLPDKKSIAEMRAYKLYTSLDSGFFYFTNLTRNSFFTGDSSTPNLSGDCFGTSVSINSPGNIIAVGEPFGIVNNITGGIVNIFSINSSSNTNIKFITGDNLGLGNPSGDLFGWSTSLNSEGNILAIGAPNVDTNVRTGGAAYIFANDPISGWIQTARLTGNTFGSGDPNNDMFGWSISLGGNTNILAVGAPFADISPFNNTSRVTGGAAYVFTGINRSWNQVARITGNSFGSGDPSGNLFGWSVHLNTNSDVLAIGAPNSDTNIVTGGAVYIFTGIQRNWTQAARLTGNTLSFGSPANQFFGASISSNADGKILAIGAYNSSTNGLNAGAVYIFTGDRQSPWTQTARLTGNTLGLGSPNNSQFGYSVNLDYVGNVLAVGAPLAETANLSAGAVYVFTGRGNTWNQINRITGNVTGLFGNPSQSRFGSSIDSSLNGRIFAIGAPFATQIVQSKTITGGAVYIFSGGVDLSGLFSFSGIPIAQSPEDSGIKRNSPFYTDNLSLKFQLNSIDELSFSQLENLGATQIKNKVNFNKNYIKDNNYGDLKQFYMDLIIDISGTGQLSSTFNTKISNINFEIGKDTIGKTYNQFSPGIYFFKSIDGNIPALKMSPRSSYLFTGGFTGGLPISIFFVESGNQFSGQKTIQSLNKSGFMTTRSINTGALIEFSGVTYTRLRNPNFNDNFQIGNLLMDTGRLLYYVNNSLIYSGASGFNLEYMMLGSNPTRLNNFSGTGITGFTLSKVTGLLDDVGAEGTFALMYPELYYNNVFGFSGNIHEILIYNSFLNEKYKNTIYSYLTNKWSGIYAQEISGQIFYYKNKADFPKNYKTNCSDCDAMINATPKEKEKHILLLEYNLYGFSGTDLYDCDIDMHAYIIKTGFHEEIVKKDPFKSLFSINFNSGLLKNSLQKIQIKSPNINNICDMNYTYNQFISGTRDDLKSIQANTIFYKPPKEESCIPDYIKYGKIYGNKI